MSAHAQSSRQGRGAEARNRQGRGGTDATTSALSMDRTAVAKMGAVASVSVCALLGGVVLAQYIFTVKKRTGRKTKIIEMVRSEGGGAGWPRPPAPPPP